MTFWTCVPHLFLHKTLSRQVQVKSTKKKIKVDLMMSGLFCLCNMHSLSINTSMHSKSILISYSNHYFHTYLFIHVFQILS